MIAKTKKILTSVFFTVATILFVACANEEIADLSEGTLRLSISQTSKKDNTRATPSEIGKPVAKRFNIKIQRSGSQYVAYDGKFIESIGVKVGTYDITATYGTNAPIGKDSPYYLGTAKATIEQDKTTAVSIPCRVANSLISVRFGRNEEEKQRFDKYYKNYGLLVKVGNYSLAIECEHPESSIYFPAGSTPTLKFYGTTNDEEEKTVSFDLSSEQFPASFAAAEHAIVTLNLPDPESALNVNITKVDLETVLLDETIPLSWLPVSKATASHQYDNNGALLGTDVKFSNSYPGMKWKAEVTNSNNEKVREITGQGELISNHETSTDWPYLPVGNYKATYYIVSDGSANKIGSRDFYVDRPEINVKVDGYTSYTKYLEGDVDAANSCERKTVYSPAVMLNISESLLNSGKYNYSFSYTYDGVTEQVAAGKNAFSVNYIENQSISLSPHVLKANATFDGISVEASKDFYITGLPVNYTPPTEAQGWVAATDRITFSNNEVKLGAQGGITAHSNEYIYNNNFAIPASTKVSLDYDVMIHPATVGTTLTITIGNSQLFSQTQNGGAFNSTDYPHKGTNTTTLIESVTQMRCLNSYGGGNTGSHIYSLVLKYSK